MKKYLILTYGCQMNENDSQRLGGLLQKIGYEETSVMEEADAILLNTCCVRESAELKIYGKIGELKGLKREKPSLIVGVCGCMAQKNQKALFKRAPHIDFVVGPNNLHDVPNIIAQIGENRSHILATDDGINTESDHVPTVRKQGMTAWVPIMYGCNNFCTYCIVPYVRGRERSRTIAEICAEIEGLAQEGCREVTLLGQNVNSYRWENGETVAGFADLLGAVASVDPKLRVRFSTSHPKDLSDEVLHTMARYPNLCRAIHLPAQSGSTRMLELMNRKYTREWYLGRIEAIRRILPGCSISTDLIAGFCTETDDDHRQTLSLMEEVDYASAFMFKYSERPNTKAARHMADDVPDGVKTARLNEIIALQNELSLRSNRLDVGREFEVLVEGVSKRSDRQLFGRTSQNKVVVFDRGDARVGDYVRVRVTDCSSATLHGQRVE